MTCVLLETQWLDITSSGGNVRMWVSSARCMTPVISNGCTEWHKCHLLGSRRSGTCRRASTERWCWQEQMHQTSPAVMRGHRWVARRLNHCALTFSQLTSSIDAKRPSLCAALIVQGSINIVKVEAYYWHLSHSLLKYCKMPIHTLELLRKGLLEVF